MSNNEILELKAAIMELTVNIKHMALDRDWETTLNSFKP